jgi:hypothetical protein
MALLQISEPGLSAGAAPASAGGRHRPGHHQFARRHGAQRHRRGAQRRGRQEPAALHRALQGRRRASMSATRRRAPRPSIRATPSSRQALHGARPEGRRPHRAMPYDFVDAEGMVRLRTVAGVKSPVEVSAEILKVLRSAPRPAWAANSLAPSSPCRPISTMPSARPPRTPPAGRPQRAAPAQRADGGGHRLRPRQRLGGRLCRLRPRRRHLRHLHPEALARRVRGAGHQRRRGARRRRLRPARVLLDPRRRQNHAFPASRTRAACCSRRARPRRC